MNNFLKRTISAVVFAAVMLAALLTNKFTFGIVMLFALIVMMCEFLRMTCGKSYWFSQILSVLAGATLFTLTYLFKGFDFPGRFVILAFVPVFILMINSLYVKDKSRFDKFSNLYAAILYIAVPWSVLNFAVFGQEGEFSGLLLLSLPCCRLPQVQCPALHISSPIFQAQPALYNPPVRHTPHRADNG